MKPALELLPWKVLEGPFYDCQYQVRSQPDPSNQVPHIVARCDTLEEARLIAAAPELLGALRFILAFYDPGQIHLDTEAWKCAEAQARALVAYIEGSQS